MQSHAQTPSILTADREVQGHTCHRLHLHQVKPRLSDSVYFICSWSSGSTASCWGDRTAPNLFRLLRSCCSHSKTRAYEGPSSTIAAPLHPQLLPPQLPICCPGPFSKWAEIPE